MRAATVAVVRREAGFMGAGKIQCRARHVKVPPAPRAAHRRGTTAHHPDQALAEVALRRPLPVAALACVAVLASAGCGRPAGPPVAAVATGEPLILPEHYARSIAALGVPGAHRAFPGGQGTVSGAGTP